VELWRTGELTGSLDVTLERLAAMTGDQAEFTFTELARWLPRVIYFLVVIYMAYMFFKFGMAIIAGSAAFV
jgi:hypothetical protein